MNILLLTEDDFTDSTLTLASIEGERVKHIRRTLQKKVGDSIKIGVLNNRLGTAEICELSKKHVTLKVTCDSNPPKPLPATLIVALPRPKSFKKVLYSAICHGVKEIYFVKTKRVERSYWESTALEDDKIEHIIFEALQQVKDTVPPKIYFRKKLKPFIDEDLPALLNDSEFMLFHPVTDSDDTFSPQKGLNYTIFIGPEGGFIPHEVELLTEAGAKCVHLGERILRVEHAVSAVLGHQALTQL